MVHHAGWAPVSAQPEAIVYAYSLLFAVLIFPSIVSKITSLFGWVKLSYVGGGISYFYFNRSVFSGALMRGIQATYHLSSDQKKRDALHWLKARCLRRKGKIYSGEMVLVVIIDCLLTRPKDAKYLSEVDPKNWTGC